MPAKSKAQQAFMAIAEHEPGKLRDKKPNMSHQQLHDFAATPTKGLPEKIGNDGCGTDGAHPGFKAVQKKIEGEGYSKGSAGAILASASRHASPAAKKANPRLNKVIGHDGKPCHTCETIHDRDE